MLFIFNTQPSEKVHSRGDQAAFHAWSYCKSFVYLQA